MTRTPLLLLAGLALAGSALAAPAKIRRIVLERTPCYGFCPAYTLTLDADGTAEYVGGRNAPRQGTYRGTFGGGLTRIAPLIDRLGFWKLKSVYTANVTDLPSQIVTIVTDGGKKTVHEYGGTGPAELFAVQTLVDGLAANVRWTKK